MTCNYNEVINTRLASLEAGQAALQAAITSLQEVQADHAAILANIGNGSGNASGRVLIGMYGNTNNQEATTTIPITKGSPYTRRRIMSATSGEVKAGDLFVVLCEFQVTSSYAYNCMISSVIMVNNSTAYEGGLEVTEANGQNFRGDEEHHFVVTKVGAWTAPEDAESKVFNAYAWAASSAAATSGHSLTVDQDYGRLTILHFR